MAPYSSSTRWRTRSRTFAATWDLVCQENVRISIHKNAATCWKTSEPRSDNRMPSASAPGCSIHARTRAASRSSCPVSAANSTSPQSTPSAIGRGTSFSQASSDCGSGTHPSAGTSAFHRSQYASISSAQLSSEMPRARPTPLAISGSFPVC